MEKTHKLVAFHDETKFCADIEYKGHILFFIPEHLAVTSRTPLFGEHIQDYSPIELLAKKIRNLRENHSCNRKFHFTDISGKTWYKSDFVTRQVIEIAVDALRKKGSKKFSNPLNCKMAVLFFSSHTDLSLYGGEVRKERRLRHHETVLRVLLKGALHYLYSEEESIEVKGLISDGDPFHRKLNDRRIINRITFDGYEGRSFLQENVSFGDNSNIKQISSDHKEYEFFSKDWINANFLQVSDLLLGSTIRSCHVGCVDYPRIPKPHAKVEDKKGVVAYPVKRMLSKVKRGYGFRYSGHNRSFSVSFIDFQDDQINFTQLRPIDIQINDNNLQLSL